MNAAELPPFYRPHVPHSNRRAAFHNYKAPGCYMITISKDPDAPIFSTLSGNPLYGQAACSTPLTPIGEIIENQILLLNEDERFQIENFVIMPDHIHILWRVKEWLKKDLGHYVGLFKAACSNAWRHEREGIPWGKPPGQPATFYDSTSAMDSDEVFPATGSSDMHDAPLTAWQSQPRFHRSSQQSLFLPKFNDRICFDEELERRFDNYISDNPRRRLMVMLYPDIFSVRHRVRILDQEFDVFGNFNLLKHPIIAPVIVSSRYTPEERAQHDALCDEAIRSGGVLISPFIHEKEKDIMNAGIAENASIIKIIPDGIPPKYKPQGKDFELCAAGRCLHIGIPRDGSKLECRRDYALYLNKIARWIAGHPAETLTLINAAPHFRR